MLFDDLLDTAKSALGDSADTVASKRLIRSVILNITSDVLLSPGQIYLPAIAVNVLLVAPGS